jgi:hypothetical protein
MLWVLPGVICGKKEPASATAYDYTVKYFWVFNHAANLRFYRDD